VHDRPHWNVRASPNLRGKWAPRANARTLVHGFSGSREPR
jgi:hypothetical protein